MPLQLSFHHGARQVNLPIDELILIGYGGRNSAQVEAHIESEGLGRADFHLGKIWVSGVE